MSAAISTATVRIVHEYTGRGPTKARTLIDNDCITVLLADSLTKGERALVDHGRAEEVMGIRKTYQDAMSADLTVAVERISQRKVIAFMSANHIEPDLGAEIFILEPSE